MKLLCWFGLHSLELVETERQWMTVRTGELVDEYRCSKCGARRWKLTAARRK